MPNMEGMAESFANNQDKELSMPGIYAMPKEVASLLLNSRMQIERIQHNLAGEIQKTYEDKEGNIYQQWVPEGERKMNDMGIRHIVSLLDAYITPNTASSNLSIDEIYSIATRVYKTLNQALRAKGDLWEVDRNYKATILNTITDMIFIELKKAQDGMTLKSLTQSIQVRELRGYGNEKKPLELSDFSPIKVGGGGK